MTIRVNDDEWSELRKEPRRLAKLHKETILLRNRAKNGNYKIEAARLSTEAKLIKQRMIKANKLAADQIFKRTNEGRPAREIDLHYLYIPEAIERLNQRIAIIKKIGLSELVVIVGKGLHSENGPKLKPAIEKYARIENINFTPNFPNDGCILFEFAPRSSQRPGYQPIHQSSHPRHTSIEMPNNHPSSNLNQAERGWCSSIWRTIAMIIVVLLIFFAIIQLFKPKH